MSSQPAEPHAPPARTVALDQHKIETAISFWRNGDHIVQRHPEPRRAQYVRAVARVLDTLQAVGTVPLLIHTYYSRDQERLDALVRACDVDGGFPLNRGIVEDCAYYLRFQEIVATSQQGGPFSRP